MSIPHLDRLFLTVAEVAPILRVDERTVRRGVERNEIPAVRIGNVIRIPAAAFYEMCGLTSETNDRAPPPGSAA